MPGQRTDYLSWDETFMQMAHLIAQRSKDPSTQAGTVIVDDKNVIVGLGYNGWPRGVNENAFPWGRDGDFLETKYAFVVHAEENAVYNANRSVEGCRLYSALFPCNECAKTLVQCGIKEVIFASDKYHDLPAWIASRRILDNASVAYRPYTTRFTLRFEPNEAE